MKYIPVMFFLPAPILQSEQLTFIIKNSILKFKFQHRFSKGKIYIVIFIIYESEFPSFEIRNKYILLGIEKIIERFQFYKNIICTLDYSVTIGFTYDNISVIENILFKNDNLFENIIKIKTINLK